MYDSCQTCNSSTGLIFGLSWSNNNHYDVDTQQILFENLRLDQIHSKYENRFSSFYDVGPATKSAFIDNAYIDVRRQLSNHWPFIKIHYRKRQRHSKCMTNIIKLDNIEIWRLYEHISYNITD